MNPIPPMFRSWIEARERSFVPRARRRSHISTTCDMRHLSYFYYIYTLYRQPSRRHHSLKNKTTTTLVLYIPQLPQQYSFTEPSYYITLHYRAHRHPSSFEPVDTMPSAVLCMHLSSMSFKRHVILGRHLDTHKEIRQLIVLNSASRVL